MAELTVDIDGLDGVLRQLAGTEEQIGRASVRAVRKTAQYAAREVARGIAAEEQIPVRKLYRARGRSRGQRVILSPPRNGEPKASVWTGTSPIKAAYVGAMRQTKAGARAGKHFFERAFVATMPSGHKGIFRRKGRDRLPIEEQIVELEAAPLVVARVEREIPTRLKDLLDQEINYEVNVRGA